MTNKKEEEKIVKTYTCKRCPTRKEIELKPTLGFMRDPKKPKGWGIRNGIELCSSCVSSYDKEHAEWFIDWMKRGKKIQ